MLNILIDSREQLPYGFRKSEMNPVIDYITSKGKCLKTGDYIGKIDIPDRPVWEIEPHACICIERKSLTDLYSTLSSRRDNLEAEFKRMSDYDYAAIVIEASWNGIMNPNEKLTHMTKMKPKSVVATLLAWSLRNNVHIHTAESRNFAERFTFRLIERWYRDIIAIGMPPREKVAR